MHANAEDEICYLAMFGTSLQALAQVKDAVAELDEIRQAVAEARLQPCGTAAGGEGSTHCTLRQIAEHVSGGWYAALARPPQRQAGQARPDPHGSLPGS